MTKVSVETSPALISPGAKNMVKAGGGLTVSVAVLVPLLPSEDTRGPLVVMSSPLVCPVTLTVTVQI